MASVHLSFIDREGEQCQGVFCDLTPSHGQAQKEKEENRLSGAFRTNGRLHGNSPERSLGTAPGGTR